MSAALGQLLRLGGPRPGGEAGWLGERRDRLMKIELERGRSFVLWVHDQGSLVHRKDLTRGFLLCRRRCPPSMWSHFSVSLKEALRAGHRWNMVCPAQQLPRKLCHQDDQCEKAQGDHLLPWGYVKHHGQGEPASPVGGYRLGLASSCHCSDGDLGKGAGLAVTDMLPS